MPSLFTHPVHLGLGAKVLPLSEFTGMDWYADYGALAAADGDEGRLVSLYAFEDDWTSWEMHPAGDELVLCLAGSITLHQELADGAVKTVTLGRGDYAINPPGVWHTADVNGTARGLFITPGSGTQNRPR